MFHNGHFVKLRWFFICAHYLKFIVICNLHYLKDIYWPFDDGNLKEEIPTNLTFIWRIGETLNFPGNWKKFPSWSFSQEFLQFQRQLIDNCNFYFIFLLFNLLLNCLLHIKHLLPLDMNNNQINLFSYKLSSKVLISSFFSQLTY